jgi:hypothetical protein
VVVDYSQNYLSLSFAASLWTITFARQPCFGPLQHSLGSLALIPVEIWDKPVDNVVAFLRRWMQLSRFEQVATETVETVPALEQLCYMAANDATFHSAMSLRLQKSSAKEI